MNANEWAKVREIFEQAVELPVAERLQFVAAACADQPQLQSEVLALLAADDEAAAESPDFVVGAAPDLIAALQADDRSAHVQSLLGRRVGPWRLERELGQGGMGQVFLAARDDGAYRQQAAVKMLRQGFDSAELIARFRAERQILAALQHPNIARLIDGGIDAAGHPYFALEYVEGEHLQHYCDRRQLGLNDRIRLLLSVCDAVSFAHRQLVVHRDLKPSNVLVDADGRVKLLDFGIAKILQQDGAMDASAVRLFTPEFAAPEQVRGEPVTTGVDVYALGLMLYQLLTGQRPYGRTASTPAAYEQAILTQEPDLPSRAAQAEQAGVRGLDAPRLRRQLRGDLDAIVLQALRKRPEDRYTSVDAMADDLRRHLARQPVLARRGAWRYRLGRFVQRHALAVGLGALAVMSLLVGLGFALWQADVARRERDAAAREALTAQRALGFMREVFTLADPSENLGKQVSAVDLLAKGSADIRAQLRDEPEVRVELLRTLGDAQLGLGQTQAAKDLLAEALQAARGLDSPLRLARVMASYGAAIHRLGDAKSDIALMQEALQLPLGDSSEEQVMRAQLELRLAMRYSDASQWQLAEPLYDTGLARMRRASGELDPSIWIPYTSLLHATGRADQAEPILRQAIADVDARLPEIHPDRAALRAQLATNLMRRSRTEEALPLMHEALAIKQKVYGDDHPSTDITRHNLARSLTELGRWAEAEAMFHAVLKNERARHGADSLRIAASEAGLARTLLDSGRAAEAEPLWRHAHQIALNGYGEFDTAVGICQLGLGRTLIALDRPAEAESALRRAAEVYTHLGDNGRGGLSRVRVEQLRFDLLQARTELECEIADRDRLKPNEQAFSDVVVAGCLLVEARRAAAAPAELERHQRQLSSAFSALQDQLSDIWPERRDAEELMREIERRVR